MIVAFHANIYDSDTQEVAKALRDPFKALGERLSKDYGGEMRHLWIDFELFRGKRGKPFPFRYQKKVSPRALVRSLPSPTYENVGHFSVRPDFGVLLATPLQDVPLYALSTIYSATAVLIEKQKKLGGFDAHAFRSEFLAGCEALGYAIPEPENAH